MSDVYSLYNVHSVLYLFDIVVLLFSFCCKCHWFVHMFLLLWLYSRPVWKQPFLADRGHFIPWLDKIKQTNKQTNKRALDPYRKWVRFSLAMCVEEYNLPPPPHLKPGSTLTIAFRRIQRGAAIDVRDEFRSGGALKPSCPNSFSITCMKIKWICPNVTWFPPPPVNSYLKNSRGPSRLQPPSAPWPVRLWAHPHRRSDNTTEH